MDGDALRGAGEGAGANVIGGDGEWPAAEPAVQRFQVPQGGVRGGDGVAPFVHPPIDGQPLFAGGVGLELPQPGGAAGRHGEGFQTALDDGQETQLPGNCCCQTAPHMAGR